MPAPQAFIAIEKTMAAAMHVQWIALSNEIMDQLHPLILDQNWSAAHALADSLTMQGVVSEVRPRLEELAVTSLLFGAHHVTGEVSTTSFAQGAELPPAMMMAIDQLVEMVENDAADFVRKQLHATIAALQQKDETTHFQKDDLDERYLADNGGLQEPERGDNKRKKKIRKGDKTLYVSRPLVNADEVIAWAHTQGFKNVQQPKDMHVTVCYSKEPFDWDDTQPRENTVKVIHGLRELHAFGKVGDAIVLTFDSTELGKDHTQFLDDGASYDFEFYRPHITITWLGAPRTLEELTPYSGPLIFGPEVFKAINDDWKEEHEEVQLRKASAKRELSLAEKLNDAVARGGRVAIDIGANLTTSRLVSLGFLAEAQKSGVERYKVNEVLDSKTCPVCRYMHGKTFKVDNEYSRMLQSLQTSDPQDLRSLSPWPGQSKGDMQDLYDMSLGEMQGEGYGSPPYHPGCRGILMLEGNVEEHIPLGGGMLDQPDAGDDQIDGLFSMGSGMGVAEEEGGTWDEGRVSELRDAIYTMADEDMKASAEASFEAGEYNTALEIAQDDVLPEDAVVADDTQKGWTVDDIEALKWGRFEVTDPADFQLIDDAFGNDDYDEAQHLLDAWKAGKPLRTKKEEVDTGPYAGRKKRKLQTPAGRDQDYTDIKPDSSQAGFDVVTEVNAGAPIDRT